MSQTAIHWLMLMPQKREQEFWTNVSAEELRGEVYLVNSRIDQVFDDVTRPKGT